MPGMCEMRCSPRLASMAFSSASGETTHMMWPLLALTSGQPRSEASIASRAADDFASSVLIDSFGLELAGSIAVVLQEGGAAVVSSWYRAVGQFGLETPVASAAALHSLLYDCRARSTGISELRAACIVAVRDGE